MVGILFQYIITSTMPQGSSPKSTITSVLPSFSQILKNSTVPPFRVSNHQQAVIYSIENNWHVYELENGHWIFIYQQKEMNQTYQLDVCVISWSTQNAGKNHGDDS